jgi:hypothetical protein
MNDQLTSDLFKKIFLILGILTAIGLLGYGLAYLIVMPQVSPEGFVPRALENDTAVSLSFGTIQAIFILIYAFSFLPVSVMFTVKKYHLNPYAMVLACCLLGISSMLEISNNLPVVATGIYPGEFEQIPVDVLLYLKQIETIQYLALDVAGFSLIYAAVFVYALVYYRSHRWLSHTIFASIILFVLNVPCLWFAPHAAVILMAISIFALVPVPVFLAREAIA